MADDGCTRPDATNNTDADQLREEIAAAKDRELRAVAELDNYRKRIARQLKLSVRAVEARRRKMREKMRAKSLADLMGQAISSQR